MMGRKFICRHCGNKFHRIKSNQRYCSRSCKATHTATRYKKNHPERVRIIQRDYQRRKRLDPEYRKTLRQWQRNTESKRIEKIICRNVYDAQDDDNSLFNDPLFVEDLTGITCERVISETIQDGESNG